MKIKNIIISLLLFLIPTVSLAEEITFINGFEDLPLMREMTILEDVGITFDSLSGSIIEVYTEAPNIKYEDVFNFYEKTLPQLGWVFNKNEQKLKSFSREEQNLTIEYIENSSGNIFRFSSESTF